MLKVCIIFLFVIIYMAPNFKYFGLKWFAILLETIAICLICGYVIANYFHDHVLVALFVSFGIWLVVVCLSLMALFQTGLIETLSISLGIGEEIKPLVSSNTVSSD